MAEGTFRCDADDEETAICEPELSAPSDRTGGWFDSAEQPIGPGQIFGIGFLGYCIVPLQPFVRRKICKLR